jgi:hypothetical protein
LNRYALAALGEGRLDNVADVSLADK